MSANKLKTPLQIEEELAEKIKQKQLKKQPARPLSENKIREKQEVKAEEEEKEQEEAKEGDGSQETSPKPKRKSNGASRGLIKAMNLFGLFERNQIARAMPFILFVTCLIMFYIANSYYAEGIIRDIDKMKVDLKERRAEYISTMSRLMYQSKQSEVAKSLQPYGVKESTEPPHKIIISTPKEKKEQEDGN